MIDTDGEVGRCHAHRLEAVDVGGQAMLGPIRVRPGPLFDGVPAAVLGGLLLQHREGSERVLRDVGSRL